MNITLGQYVPGNSLIHRLDPRTKLLSIIAYIVLIFLVKSMVVFLIPIFFLVMATLLSGISPSYIVRSLKPMRVILIFMFLINLFFTQGETVFWSWKFLSISKESIRQSFFIMLRLVLLVSGSSLLTLSTSPIALTDGLEKLLRPLQVIRFPAHEMAMMMSIALRFIPTLIEETDRIRKAQMARGADFESGNLFAKAKAMIPVLVPLFVSAFRRADELAMAMESRCYHGGEGRTRMHELSFALPDAIAGLVVLLFVAAVPVVEHFM